MHQRLNISLPEATVRLLDRAVAKGERSKFIDRAVRSELARAERAVLRRNLEEGYRTGAEEDRRMAAEWDYVSAESWARLDHEEKR